MVALVRVRLGTPMALTSMESMLDEIGGEPGPLVGVIIMRPW